MRTQFHPSHDWSSWRPERRVLDALVGLCAGTWSQPTTFRVELRTAKRTDGAESADEARQLLDTDGALTAATSIDVIAAGPHDSLDSLYFSWRRQSATLSVSASDELAATALINKAVAILDAGAVDSGALSLDEAPDDIKTEFRASHRWPHWRPDPAILRSALEQCERAWPQSPRVMFELSDAERKHRVENAEHALRLLDDDRTLASATNISLWASGPNEESIASIVFDWHGESASLSVHGRDGPATEALKDRLATILNAGATEPAALGAVEQTSLRLARRRFVGTYADVGQLIRDLTDQVRQVRQLAGSLDHVYIALTEPGRTITIGHLVVLW